MKGRFFRPRRPRPTQNPPRMSAREKREGIGVVLMIAGFVLIVVGALVSYSEWHSLPVEKLALELFLRELAPGILLTFIGFALFVSGFGVYTASSNEQAWRRIRKRFL